MPQCLLVNLTSSDGKELQTFKKITVIVGMIFMLVDAIT